MRLYKLLAPVAAALAFAGCGGPSHPPKPSPGPVQASGHTCLPSNYFMQCAAGAPGQVLGNAFGVPSQFGLDAYTGSPSGSFARAHGAHFEASYVPLGSKGWRSYQLASYHAAGLGTVVVWESSAARAEDGWSAGWSDARRSASEMAALGEPVSRPIFFAVDTDTSAARVASYFAGADAAIGRGRVGVYGGYFVVSGLFDRRLVTHGWQTLAWSFGRWDGRACLRQTGINANWFGYSVDYNLAICADYGQWPYSPPAPRLACFGRRAQVHNATCVRVRREVASWDRAAGSSLRAFEARGCLELALRKNWFARQLRLHPRSARTAYRRRALAATQRVYNRRSCGVFSGRVTYFLDKSKAARVKYRS